MLAEQLKILRFLPIDNRRYRPGTVRTGCQFSRRTMKMVNMMKSNSWTSMLAWTILATLPLDGMGADLRIRFDGIDGAELGTPLSKIRIPLEQPIRKTDQQPSGHCFYASPENDKRFALMFVADVLARIDVMQPGLRTAAGIGVGDPVSKVREVYGRAMKDEPDFYDDLERYLTVTSKDGRYSIRFMTSDGKVSAIISGTRKSVQYVEGCL
jgi:hypothetical protein